MNPIKHSLYWRILFLFCFANLLVLFLGAVLTRGFIAYTTSVEINWAALAQDADQAYIDGGRAALADWIEQQRQQGIEATLLDHGQPLQPIRLQPSLAAQLPGWLADERSFVMKRRPGLYVSVQQVTGSDGQPRQLLALSRSHAHLRPQTRERIYLGVQLVLALLFIGLVGWWVARSVARPVQALRRATRRMADGELSTRVGRQGGLAHDELAQLADDFDTMAERIEALVAHDRGVLQDLSHELRSPLARLQLILDLARRSAAPDEAATYFQQAELEIGRLDRMLGEMLALSRLETQLPGMASEPIELSELVRGCLEQSRFEADARQVQLCMSAQESLTVPGHPLLIERALDNLLSNAIKFSSEGGLVGITVRSEQGFAEITVRDHGPGVPEAELASLFRPFYRGSNAARAEGHGLGLAIVQRVVQAHGGTIEVHNAEDGGGLEIRLRLPLASPCVF